MSIDAGHPHAGYAAAVETALRPVVPDVRVTTEVANEDDDPCAYGQAVDVLLIWLEFPSDPGHGDIRWDQYRGWQEPWRGAQQAPRALRHWDAFMESIVPPPLAVAECLREDDGTTARLGTADEIRDRETDVPEGARLTPGLAALVGPGYVPQDVALRLAVYAPADPPLQNHYDYDDDRCCWGAPCPDCGQCVCRECECALMR